MTSTTLIIQLQQPDSSLFSLHFSSKLPKSVLESILCAFALPSISSIFGDLTLVEAAYLVKIWTPSSYHCLHEADIS